jgi:hypothetical protein
MRFPYVVLLSACALTLVLPLAAQSPNGVLDGLVVDSSNGAIVAADVIAVSDVTAVQYSTKTNGEGIYVLPNLPPGPYRLQVSKFGFKTIIKTDIVVHIQDSLALNFTLPVGATAEVVTVTGGAPLLNTENATVSTVVDRKYVDNMPLNGRSFQDLILLTPGIVTNSPQSGARGGDFGEFSVNGQRTETNYYTVDGVSANLGLNPGQVLSAGNSGSLPAATALGTTQGLVSVDALEEFRVQSSTYSAEFGRNAGGQFSFVTRSGTNQWHGNLFEYFRNDIFDASDWFNGLFSQPKTPLRQNDFGGTLGGPIRIPGLYNGKDRTFFFLSYEGLRLLQPQPASISTVPTIALRQSVPTALQSLLNAFPLPNCPPSASNCTADFGDGLGQFIGSWSNPGSIDSYSVRLDHFVSQRFKVFFRFSDALSSQALQRGGDFVNPAMVFRTEPRLQTYTLGATSALSQSISNEFRLNYSLSAVNGSSKVTAFGGAQATDIAALHGVPEAFYDFSIFMGFSGFTHNTGLEQLRTRGSQQQWNITDAISTAWGHHQFKFGLDFRRLALTQRFSNPLVFYEYDNEVSLTANNADFASTQATSDVHPNFINFSAFTQDEWHVGPRLSLSLGLRWDVNPAPSAGKGNLPYTFEGDIGTPDSLTVAPRGTPLWRTSWYNFVPRVGAAYAIRTTAGSETVVRGGAGIFFDTGQQQGTFGYNGAGFTGSASYCPGCGTPAVFPLIGSQLLPPITIPPPASLLYGFAHHLQLPYTWQWNATIQQALGTSQALTLSYVGASARRLLQHNQLSLASVNPEIGTLIYIKNGLTSDYDALQVQLQRRLSHGLQALASYTWSHSIDFGSNDSAFAYLRGDSDFDVRHNFSAALSYELPGSFHNRIAKAILGQWSIDDRLSARTAFPVPLNGPRRVNPATLQSYNAGLDLVPGSDLIIYSSQFPGGKRINPDAFSVPPIGNVGNSPRNVVRGFGAWQMDFAIRRDFPIRERLKIQFRAEAFNIFNHPNFGTINTSYCPASDPLCTFGEATAILAQSLGGLSPLYQMGGPRSLQFAAKLVF